MSKCVVHMTKLKMSAMGGIQSHNQREHESRKNKEIDYELSKFNFDTVNAESINYHRAVKERIDELNLKKAVRKDAVVYCSFIVSSDQEFFQQLGERIHLEKCKKERAENWWDTSYEQSYVPFAEYPREYQTECIRRGAEDFFQYATEFFQKRYGRKNVLNGTVHMDETTPHMHLGVVPVTSDRRLSAKDRFTPLELKQLQTAFAEKVGVHYGLERGKEGSEAKHLDEVSFKLKHRTEQVEELSNSVQKLENQRYALESDCKDLEKRRESLNKAISDLDTIKDTLEDEIATLEGRLDAVEGDRRSIMERFVELPQVKPVFDDYFQKKLKGIAQRQQQRQQQQQPKKKRKNKDLEL